MVNLMTLNHVTSWVGSVVRIEIFCNMLVDHYYDDGEIYHNILLVQFDVIDIQIFRREITLL